LGLLFTVERLTFPMTNDRERLSARVEGLAARGHPT